MIGGAILKDHRAEIVGPGSSKRMAFPYAPIVRPEQLFEDHDLKGGKRRSRRR